MRVISARLMLATAILALPGIAQAQQTDAPKDPNIVVNGEKPAPPVAGPEIKGIIAARNGNKLKIVADDGTATVVAVDEATQVKGSSGLFGGGGKYTADSLLNGMPVDVRTVQADGGLLAAQVSFKAKDLKTANMIRQGTNQRFDEQTAATEALRGRMGDIDKYNIKSTTNVFFDTGKAVLSERAKADLCTAATQADGISNALILVVGYTDITGSDDVNQALSEKRASSVMHYLQQVCHWKPYRMLTPTGMATADPLADNTTPEGRAQNRRVSVNVLVSKGLDGL